MQVKSSGRPDLRCRFSESGSSHQVLKTTTKTAQQVVVLVWWRPRLLLRNYSHPKNLYVFNTSSEYLSEVSHFFDIVVVVVDCVVTYHH